MADYLQVSTTVPSANEAERIAMALVEQHLAACVQIIPQVRSIYRWQEKIENTNEWLCLVKTQRTLFDKVNAEIRRLHSFDCPEVIAVMIEAGSPDYLRWLGEQLQA